MAFSNCGSLMLWVQQKMSQDKKVSAIEYEKEDHSQASHASTTVDSLICISCSEGESDTDEADAMDNNGMKLSGKFPCPHCFQKFETEEALYEHGTCMIMPSDMIDGARSGNGTVETVGVKLDGKIPCPACNQRFDTENALNLHCKFIHDGAVFNVGYTLVYEFDSHKEVSTSRVA